MSQTTPTQKRHQALQDKLSSLMQTSKPMSSQNPIQQALDKTMDDTADKADTATAKKDSENHQKIDTPKTSHPNLQNDTTMPNINIPNLSQNITQTAPPKPTTVIKLDEKRLGDKLNNKPAEPISTPKPTALLNKAVKPTFQKVDIVIAGTTHRINCPTDKAQTLLGNAETINNNLRDMRKNVVGKSPTNEELLVLHCLELYDTIKAMSGEVDSATSQTQTLNTALDKLIADVNRIGN